MCERIPLSAVPPARGELRFERRAVLAVAGGMLLGACTAPRARRLLHRGPMHAAAPGPPVAAAAPPAPPTARTPRATPLEIVPRSAWGAEPLRDDHDPMANIRRLTLHHTDALDDLGGMTQRDDAELMRVIQRFHQDTRGWADIGYHFVIGRDGKVYEGRSLAVQGAHAGGGNNVENLGISVMGNFEQDLPTDVQMETLKRFLVAAAARYRLAPDTLFGHRDFKPTACPGDALYAWLTTFKATTARA
ncbi:MAG: peptidoglycan recognition family protein [Planctomycetota bacterium]